MNDCICHCADCMRSHAAHHAGGPMPPIDVVHRASDPAAAHPIQPQDYPVEQLDDPTQPTQAQSEAPSDAITLAGMDPTAPPTPASIRERMNAKYAYAKVATALRGANIPAKTRKVATALRGANIPGKTSSFINTSQQTLRALNDQYAQLAASFRKPPPKAKTRRAPARTQTRQGAVRKPSPKAKTRRAPARTQTRQGAVRPPRSDIKRASRPPNVRVRLW